MTDLEESVVPPPQISSHGLPTKLDDFYTPAEKARRENQARAPVSSRTIDSDGMIQDADVQNVGIATEVRLLSVDDASEIFNVALLIHVHFFDSTEKFVPDPDSEFDGFERLDEYDGYIPDIVMVNCVETQFDEFTKIFRYNRRTGVVWMSLFNNCSITEGLELEKFPFDRQLFRIAFKSANANLVKWTENTNMLDFPPLPSLKMAQDEDQRKACFLVACELKHWQMKSFFVEFFPDDPDPVSLTQGEFMITIRAERDPKFYFFNFFLVIYLIVLTNACMISIDPIAAGERNAVSITLLLTLVAFKFVLNEGTPKVGYLTYMDKYVVMSFVFIMIAVIENIGISPLVQCAISANADCDEVGLQEISENSRAPDIVFHFLFSTAWTLVNLAVAIMCFFPYIVRQSWTDVENGQIGSTDETLKRTATILNGNEREKMAKEVGEYEDVSYYVK